MGVLLFESVRCAPDLNGFRPGGDAAVQVTTEQGFYPLESPDGQYVYVVRDVSVRGIWRVPTAGGNEELVISLLKPIFWGLWTIMREGIYFLDSGAGGPPRAA